MWLSWKHEDTDLPGRLTYDAKVEVFYEQTLGWQLHIADLLANGGTAYGEFNANQPGKAVAPIRHSGFAVLHICLSYFELVGSLLTPKPVRPERAFRLGIKAVPGAIEPSSATAKVIKKLYVGARCGLYHEGRTRLGVGLGQRPTAMPSHTLRHAAPLASALNGCHRSSKRTSRNSGQSS